MDVAARRKRHPWPTRILSRVSTEREPSIDERAHRRQVEREAVLAAALDSGETVITRGAVTVTNRRVLFAWNEGFGWHSDAITFEEIRRWALGRRHDERPLVRIDHPTHLRMERVPAHHLLRFTWGNAVAEVPHDELTLLFRSKRDPSFHALVERLQQQHVPRGEDFVVALPGTRQERTSRSHVFPQRRRDRRRL